MGWPSWFVGWRADYRVDWREHALCCKHGPIGQRQINKIALFAGPYAPQPPVLNRLKILYFFHRFHTFSINLINIKIEELFI